MAENDDIPDVKISPAQQEVVDRFLLSAVADYNTTRIDLTLQKGANIDARDGNGYTALVLAVNKGYPSLVKHVLSKNPDLFVKDNWNRTVFDHVVAQRDADAKNKMIDMLLAALPDGMAQQAPTQKEKLDLVRSEAAEMVTPKKKEKAANAGIEAPGRAAFKGKGGFNP